MIGHSEAQQVTKSRFFVHLRAFMWQIIWSLNAGLFSTLGARPILILSGLLLAGTVVAGSPIGYEQPPHLTGSIDEMGPEPERVFFTFQRTAERTGHVVRVVAEYRTPQGALAARERVTYEDSKLVSYELDQFQTGAKGRGVIRHDPQHGNEQKISFEFTPRPGAKTETKSETQHTDVLVNDMIAGFLASHWDELMRGTAVKFRFIVLHRAETVGFKVEKESEGIWHGHPIVRIKMVATSVLIARLVAPVYFTVEKATSHRILQYVGRTTPKIKTGDKWEDLDAISVYDWSDLKP